LNDRGLTLVELMVGLVTATIIGAVSASILKAGLMTYNHSVRQNDAMSRTRKALGGLGAETGILRAGRAAYAVSALDASSVGVLSSTASVLTSYYVSGDGLYRSQGGVPSLHADSLTSLAVNYYNLDASGLIIESTSPVSAKLVTALVTLEGKTDRQKDYHLFSGVLLRNHP